jgi:hypothetical protein
MAEARQSAKHSIVSKASKRAFAPLAQAAVTAGSAYLTRKGMQIWQEKVQPKIDERGARTVAKETLETVAEKAGPASGPVESLAEKVGGEDESSASSRDAERRKREQRRNQRRKAVEKSGSS